MNLKSGSASGGETELLAGGTLKFDSVYSAVKATPDNPSTDGRINPTVPLISAVICAQQEEGKENARLAAVRILAFDGTAA